MKTRLMYRDRDFDSAALLSRREKMPPSRRDDEEDGLAGLLPWNETALTQDLGLNVVYSAMARGDAYLFEVAELGIARSVTELDLILYRQHVLSDCLKNAETVRRLYAIAIEAIDAERKNYLGFFSRYPSGILHRSIGVLKIFVGLLRQLGQIASEQNSAFSSEGFSRLFEMLRKELADDYLAAVEAHLERLKFRQGVLVSANLGQGNKGRDYVLRKPNPDERNWIEKVLGTKPSSYTFHVHPRDESGLTALSQLRDRGIDPVANALAQSTDHVLSFFQTLRLELGFYIGCLNLYETLAGIGTPICFPGPEPETARAIAFTNLCDAALSLSTGRKAVGNDLNAAGKDLFVITGANTGGKSTFLRSVGLAQLMMQAGMFVTAAQFSGPVASGVFTHYKREEDVTLESGKWDEELGRMSEIVDRIKPNALLLLNESFASTNEREGSEIARQIVTALLAKGVRIFFVTHLSHFARGMFEQNAANACFLRAERRPDGTRSFRIVEGEPLQTSYGEDLYRTIFADDRSAA